MQDRSPAGFFVQSRGIISEGRGIRRPLSEPHSPKQSVLQEKLVNQRCEHVQKQKASQRPRQIEVPMLQARSL
jgi:hypothetical protein